MTFNVVMDIDFLRWWSLQGDLHWYLSQKGQLELVKAVRYALDIARYVHFFKAQEILVQKEKENICNVHVLPFMMYFADHVSVSLCIICSTLDLFLFCDKWIFADQSSWCLMEIWRPIPCGPPTSWECPNGFYWSFPCGIHKFDVEFGCFLNFYLWVP